MKVLVDTPIWSLALRRAGFRSSVDHFLVNEFNDLINEARVVLIGPIRQELLSGIPNYDQFTLLKEKLQAFEDLPLKREAYEMAAEFYNTCRKAGVQGSQIDFLICSASVGAGIPIFTTDKDFPLYAKHIKLSLYHPRKTKVEH
jgi:predicted nucleic acid-binding protein